MKLTFLGAVDTVTGSRYLVEVGGRRYLVDCGLYQGYKQLRDRNWEAFPIPPAAIDAVILTHAHLDHTGYLPALVRDGFRGSIYATAGTAALCGLLLSDSAHLLEEEADFAGRHHTSTASGMISGGRILHHLLAFGADPRNAIVLTGFQSGGTRGAALRDGERTLRIYGREVDIKADVFDLETLSAHADADEILEWMRASQHAPATTFLAHGEPAAADRLRQRIEHELHWSARVPEFLECVDVAQPRRLALERASLRAATSTTRQK